MVCTANWVILYHLYHLLREPETTIESWLILLFGRLGHRWSGKRLAGLLPISRGDPTKNRSRWKMSHEATKSGSKLICWYIPTMGMFKPMHDKAIYPNFITRSQKMAHSIRHKIVRGTNFNVVLFVCDFWYCFSTRILNRFQLPGSCRHVVAKRQWPQHFTLGHPIERI